MFLLRACLLSKVARTHRTVRHGRVLQLLQGGFKEEDDDDEDEDESHELTKRHPRLILWSFTD